MKELNNSLATSEAAFRKLTYFHEDYENDLKSSDNKVRCRTGNYISNKNKKEYAEKLIW